MPRPPHGSAVRGTGSHRSAEVIRFGAGTDRGGRHGFARGFGGVFLDDDYGRGVNVNVLQNVAPAAPSGPAPFYVPSVNELPAVAGIRDVRPTQPAIYVLNEGRDGGKPATSSLRQPSPGPRILEVNPDGDWVTTTGSIAQPEASGGARIIHLTVPVGSGR